MLRTQRIEFLVLLISLTAMLSLLNGCKSSDSGSKSAPPATTSSGTTSGVTPAQEATGQLKNSKSGIQYQDLVVGTGARPLIGQSLQIFYVGRLKEGDKPFDSGVFNFNPIKDKVIKGWNIGVLGDADVEPMRVGGRRKLIIPPSLGYGSMESGPVPPNSTLIFEIELKKIINVQGPFGSLP